VRQASRLLSVLKGPIALLNAEVHSFDIADATAIASTMGLVYLSGVAQGDTAITRTGSSLKLVRFEWASRLVVHASSTGTQVRIAIVLDLANRGAVPTATDIFLDNMTGFAERFTQPGRFVVLAQRDVVLVPGADSAAWYSGVADIPVLVNTHFQYNGTDAAVASSGKTALFLVVRSSEPTNTPSHEFRSRLYFIDN
jgi:hypothetical protein